MRAAAAKANVAKKVKKKDDDKKERSFAVIELERRKYKTFLNGINSINELLDKHKIKKKKINVAIFNKDSKIPSRLFRPDDSRKVIWDIWIAALIMYSIIAIPFRIGFQIESGLDAKIFDYMVDCFFFIDIIMNFNTAIVIHEKLIINRKEIALNYFKFWFWIDGVSTIPIDTFVELSLGSDNGNALTAVRLIRIIRLVRLLKLARVFKLRNVAEHLENLNINPAIMNVLKLIFQIFFIAHLVCCFWYFLTTGNVVGYNSVTGEKQKSVTWITSFPEIENGTTGDQYVASLFWTIATMVAVGYGDIHAENIQERIYSIVVMLSGGILFGAIIGETTRLIESRNPQAKMIKEKMNNLKGYLSEKSLSPRLRKAAKVAYTYYLQKNVSFGEQGRNNLLNDLPVNLQKKLAYKLYEKEISCIHLFSSSDKLFVIRLVQFCQPIHSTIGEILYDFGDVTNEFVFIMKGLVSISGEELIGYATEGYYFMDFEFLMNTLSLATYKVVEQSHLFIIRYNVISEACGDFVEAGDALKEELIRRYKVFKDILKIYNPEKIAHRNSFKNSISGHIRPFWINGVARDTFDRHVDDIFSDNDTKSIYLSCIRVIVKHDASTWKVIEVPKEYLTRKFLIYPDDPLKLRWDSLIGSLIVYSVLYLPVQIAFDESTTYGIGVFDHVLDALFMVDIIISSRIAYYESNEDAYMTDSKQIHNYYLKTWLVIDVCSGVPFDTIFTESISGSRSNNLSSLRLVKVLRLIRLLKLVRLLKLSKYIYKLEDALDIPPALFDLLSLMFRVILLGHFLACVWWGTTASMSSEPWFVTTPYQPQGSTFTTCSTSEKYVASLYWTFTTLATVGYGDYLASTTSERILNIFIMLIGATTFGYIVANVSGTFGSLNQTQALKREKMSMITSILSEKNIPDNLSSSIINHFKNFYNQISAYDEEVILSGLPRKISNEISTEIYKETMDKIRIFKYIDNQSVALQIFSILLPSNFKSGQVILSEGTAALEMFFLLSGSALICKEINNNKGGLMFNWNIGKIKRSMSYKEPISRNLTEEQSAKVLLAKSKHMSKKTVRKSQVIDVASTIEEKDKAIFSQEDQKNNEVYGKTEKTIISTNSARDDNSVEGNEVELRTSFFGDIHLHFDHSKKGNYIVISDEEILQLGYEAIYRCADGDFFGHTSLLKESNYSATVVALSDCNAYTLRKSEIVKLVLNNNPVSIVLQSALAKSIHALRHSRGRHVICHERAKFLDSIKGKHIKYRTKRKVEEDKIKRNMIRNSRKNSFLGSFPKESFRIKPVDVSRYKHSKWEIVRKAVRNAKAHATVSRMIGNIRDLNEGELKTRTDDHFRKALQNTLGSKLNAVLNEDTMFYDSDSSYDESEDEINRKEINQKVGRLNFHMDNEHSLKITNSLKKEVNLKEVNLNKLKKAALVFRCHSLSNISNQIDDSDKLIMDMISFKEINKARRRQSFPSFDVEHWKSDRVNKLLI